MEPDKIDLENVREDEGKGITYVRRKSRKKRRKRRILKTILIFLVLLFAVLIGCCFYLFFSGQQKIEKKGQASRPELKPVKTREVEIKTEILDEDTIKYNGSKYRYNKDMINMLFIGVDTSGTVSAENAQADAGQSDTIFVAALNNKTKKITLIPVNRDTMTEISIYDVNGNFIGKQKEQIALSYAYGDGEKMSAELTKEAVSNLFYGLPIHGYFSVNTSAITVINDLIGGVEVSLLGDFTEYDPSYAEGSKVLLQGSFAETYLRKRWGVGDDSNIQRMARQKQYVTALASKMMTAVKQDLTLPVSIYQTVSDYMITDISVDEVSYLATQIVSYSLDGDLIRTIPGSAELVDIYMQFTVDEKAFYELILDVFYEKVQ